MVMMFGEFILNDDLFFKSFKKIEPKSFDFDFFQKTKAIVKKGNQINEYISFNFNLKIETINSKI
jgi:hypothetical protein